LCNYRDQSTTAKVQRFARQPERHGWLSFASEIADKGGMGYLMQPQALSGIN